MRHDHFLNSTGDMGIHKRQRHATLSFLKIDRGHGDPQSRAPVISSNLLAIQRRDVTNTGGCENWRIDNTPVVNPPKVGHFG